MNSGVYLNGVNLKDPNALSELMGKITAGTKVFLILMLVLTVVVGILYCYNGFKVFSWVRFLSGLVVGTNTAYLAQVLAGGSGVKVILISLAIGAVVGLLCLILYPFLIFLLGVFVGVALGAVLVEKLFSKAGAAEYLIPLALAIVIGVLFVFLIKIWTIGITSITGASLLTSVLMIFVQNQIVIMIALIALIVSGIIVQSVRSRKAGKKES